MTIINKTTDYKQLLSLFFIAGILVYFIFSPAVSALYYSGDDFRYSLGGLAKACKKDDGFEYMLTIGRPLQAYMDCMSFKFAYTLERMSYVRLGSVMLLAALVSLFAVNLARLGFSIAIALLASLYVFLVPPLYLDSILSGSISLPAALLFTLLSFFSLQRFQQVDRKKVWLISAIALLFSGLLTYPAMTFFMATLLLAQVLFSDLAHWSTTRKNVLQGTLLYCGACCVYFLWSLYNIHYHALAPVSDPNYQLQHVNLTPSEVYRRLLFLFNISNAYWAFTPFNWIRLQVWVMVGLFVGAVIFALQAFIRQKPVKIANLAQAVAAVVLLLILSGGFFLVMPAPLVEGRLFFGNISAGLLVMLWSIVQWSRWLGQRHQQKVLLAIVGLFFLINAYLTNIAMLTFGLSYTELLNFPKQAIVNYEASGKELKRVHYIVSASAYPYNKFFLTNGALIQLKAKNSYALQWCSLARGVPGAEKDHQAEMLACLDKLDPKTIAVTYSFPGEVYAKTASMLVIDMQTISASNYAKKYLKNYFNIEANPAIG